MGTLRNSRWIGVVASSWVETTAGNGYTFGVYSPTLKEVLGYDQAQLNTLGFAKDVGDNVGLLAGLVSNTMPIWGILAIGALESFVGYGVVWLVLSERIAPLPYWQMCVLLAVGANSSTWLDTACLVTCIRNFPHRRGTVTGLLKGSYGLSSAIFALLYNALFQNNAASFLLLVALGPSIVCMLAVPFIRTVPPAVLNEDLKEQPSFTWIQSVFAAFTLYLLAATLLDGLGSLKTLGTQLFAGGMLLFLAAPLGIPLICSGGGNLTCERHTSIKDAFVGDDHGTQEQLLAGNDGVSAQEASFQDCTIRSTNSREKPELDEFRMSASSAPSAELVNCLATTVQEVDRRKGPGEREDLTLRQAVLKVDFWLLFFTFFCGMGSAITAINNLGQLGEAQGYTNVSIFVSLISIWNSVGRLGGGAISDYYVRLAALPRPVWMACAQAIMMVAHLLFATAMPGSLYMASILLGVSFGVHTSIMIPTSSELFGLKHLGMVYNTMFIASPLGSLLFSGIIAGTLYDYETGNSVNALADLRAIKALYEPECIGAHCFRLTFIIMTGVCLVGIALNVVLIARTRHLYQSLYGS